METAVIGMGNPLKKDDNIGNLVIEKLSEEIKNKDFLFIKGYLTPENYLGHLKGLKPKRIYIVDAVEFKGLIGEVKIFNLEEIEKVKATTHNIPVTIYKDYFPNTSIKLIGIKVKNINFGGELSKEIEEKLDDIIKKIRSVISQ